MSFLHEANVLFLCLFEQKNTPPPCKVKAARREGDQFNAWREQEVSEGLARESKHAAERAHDARAQRVAHEKRRWQLHFYTPSGKPDKWRQPGRPWDPRALAGQERDTFCGGATVHAQPIPPINLAPYQYTPLKLDGHVHTPSNLLQRISP